MGWIKSICSIPFKTKNQRILSYQKNTTLSNRREAKNQKSTNVPIEKKIAIRKITKNDISIYIVNYRIISNCDLPPTKDDF